MPILVSRTTLNGASGENVPLAGYGGRVAALPLRLWRPSHPRPSWIAMRSEILYCDTLCGPRSNVKSPGAAISALCGRRRGPQHLTSLRSRTRRGLDCGIGGMPGGHISPRKCRPDTATCTGIFSAHDCRTGGTRGIQTGYDRAILAQHAGVHVSHHASEGTHVARNDGHGVERG